MAKISLKEQAGLEIILDTEATEVLFGKGINIDKKSVRSWEEMRGFIEETAAVPTREEVYTVWRNVAKHDDLHNIREKKLRYDITVIPEGVFAGLRKEFFRTAGHYHPLKPGTDTAYPEVYEVISGSAYFVLQRRSNEESGIIGEIYAVAAETGEKIVMPPGFGHVSINTGDQPLVLSNWINDTFSYDYEPYRIFGGPGYRLIKGIVDGTVEFEKNSSYKEVADVRKLRPREHPEFGLSKKRPLYALTNDLDRMEFLSNPERFSDQLSLERCFSMF